MKPVLLLISLFDIFSKFSTGLHPTAAKRDLLGNVKSVTTNTYTIDSVGDRKLLQKTAEQFDRVGNLIEIITYTPDETELDVRKTAYGYDSTNRLVKIRYYLVNDSFSKETTFDYRQNKLVSFTSVTGAVAEWSIGILYDTTNMSVRETSRYFKDPAYGGVSVTFLDKLGNIKECLSYSLDGILIAKFTFGYDSMGNEIEKRGYDASNWLTSTQFSKYDYQKRLIEKTGISEQQHFTTTFTYSNPDFHSNYLKLTTFRNDKQITTEERVIDYYEQ